LPTVISSQNGDTGDATASTSNTTNNSASSSISNVKNILPTSEKKRHQNTTKILRSMLPQIKIWKKQEINYSFSNNEKNKQPVIKIISSYSIRRENYFYKTIASKE
jgi:hypothetical protein